MMENNESENRFNKILVLGGLIVMSIVAYAFCVTFMTIPDANKQNAATCTGLLLGVLGLIVGFYYGSSQNNNKKPTQQDGTTTADINATITTTPTETKENQ